MIDELINEKITMVPKYAFETILRHKDKIKNVEGDIIECGVWRGGFSIFLGRVFPDKQLWVCDSFTGFQPLENGKYSYPGDRHTPDKAEVIASFEDVTNNFKNYGYAGDDPNVNFVKGFVKDTLPNLDIKKIALLRVDVDAYSATLEVLDELYKKVQPGGYIIFDDSCLRESLEAIRVFFHREGIPAFVYHPVTDEKLDIFTRYTNDDSGLPQACYIIKE